MAKKSLNAQDVFFNHNGKISLIDPFSHRVKDPIEERGAYKFPKECKDKEHVCKGFKNSITIKFDIDKKIRSRCEENLGLMNVFEHTNEDKKFYPFRHLKSREWIKGNKL